MERTDLHTFAAAGTEFFVNHVHALCVLGNRSCFAGFRAFSALHADRRFYNHVLLHDLDTGFSRIHHLVKGFGAGLYTRQTGHALFVFSNCQFFHVDVPPYLRLFIV